MSHSAARRADARPQPAPQRHDDADAQEPRRQARATGPRRPPAAARPDADAVAAAVEPGRRRGPLASDRFIPNRRAWT